MIDHPSAITIRLRVVPGRETALASHLSNAQSEAFGFCRLETIHFARTLLVPGTTSSDGVTEPTFFVIITDFDGSADVHFQQLAQRLGDFLDPALECCEGFPSAGFASEQERATFLEARSISSAALYVNRAGQSVKRIRCEHALRMRLRAFVDVHADELKGAHPSEVAERLRAFAKEDPECRKQAQGYGPLPRVPQAVDYIAAAGLGLVLLSLIWLVVPLIVVWMLLIRWLELHDRFVDEAPDPARVTLLQRDEDYFPINQFSAYGFLKPQPARGLTVRVVLWAVNFVVQRFSADRSLFGVRTIHFARWTYLSDRTLLFASNYDGSLASYMDDFIDRLAWGLNAVFSNGINYPPTRWLFLDGAKHEAEFKNFIRVHQLRTQIWYSAYPNLTCADIRANNEVCEGLLTERGRHNLGWLRSI